MTHRRRKDWLVVPRHAPGYAGHVKNVLKVTFVYSKVRINLNCRLNWSPHHDFNLNVKLHGWNSVRFASKRFLSTTQKTFLTLPY